MGPHHAPHFSTLLAVNKRHFFEHGGGAGRGVDELSALLQQAQAEAAGSGGDGEDARGGGLGVGAVGRVQVVYG